MAKKADQNKLPCPECKEPVAFDATRCPHCQAVYSPEVIEQRKKIHESGVKAGLIGCGAIVLLGVLALGFCGSGEGEPVPAPEPGTASVDMQGAVDTFNRDMIAAMSKCESAAGQLGDLMSKIESGQASIYDAFNQADFAENACTDGYLRVGDVEVPAAFDDATEDRADEAIESCGRAMTAKKMAAETFKEILDGDGRPSKVQELTGDVEYAQSTTLECGAGLAAVAAQAGAELNLPE